MQNIVILHNRVLTYFEKASLRELIFKLRFKEKVWQNLGWGRLFQMERVANARSCKTGCLEEQRSERL